MKPMAIYTREQIELDRLTRVSIVSFLCGCLGGGAITLAILDLGVI